MKKLIMILFAIVFAARVEAGTIWWSAMNHLNVGNDGTIYLFALGRGDEPTFGDGSFDTTTLTLTSTGGAEFPPNPETEMLSMLWWDSRYAVGFEIEVGIPLNQWWAVVVVNDDTLDRFGIDVFFVTDELDDSSGDAYYFRYLEYQDHQDWWGTDFLDEYVGKQLDFTQYGAIPEPATGLLALVGGALLLLRRKRK